MLRAQGKVGLCLWQIGMAALIQELHESTEIIGVQNIVRDSEVRLEVDDL